MSSSRTWPLRLKARCEAVGWTVGLTKRGHYRVRVSGGRGFSFASTSSDTFAERKALGDARRYGLMDREARLALRKESERQSRISRDRGAVGDALANALADRDEREAEDNNEEGGAAVARKEIAESAGALGYVDGVAIAEKAQAKIETPISHGPRPMTGAEELLLEDGRVIYRCAKPAATPAHPDLHGVCHRTFESVTSLRAHMTFHSRKELPVAPGQRKKIERERARRVAQVAQAATRRAPAKPTQTSPETPGVIARMVELTGQFERFQGELEIMSKSAHELATELHELARLLPESVADDSTLEKVKKYDELRRLIG